MFWSCVINVIILLWSLNSLATASYSNESDRLALLTFKDHISKDPLGAMSSWNDSLHYCEWRGITCSPRHRQRVTVLALESQKLDGTLSPHIGNLTFLRKIVLTGNNFHGPIPQELGRLFRLRGLYLNNNSFNGEIPVNLTHCSNLKIISLADNHLSGTIPPELTSLLKLVYLVLGRNILHGTMPSSIGNLSSLLSLALSYNNIGGTIPYDLCRIHSLAYVSVSLNKLRGMFPICVYNLSRIVTLGLAANQLHGEVPPDIGTLPNLQFLYLGGNNFKGQIPVSLSNASRLEVISLELNSFTGSIPRDLGRLQNLSLLAVHSNQLGTTFGDDLNFITSLTNCSVLKELSVANNSLKGSIPNSIANLSTQIAILQLGINEIYGRIPVGIKNLVNLGDLDLEQNELTGEIPSVIEMFPKMHRLFLQGNQFSGEIPDTFNNSTLLEILNLSGNKLRGSIPTSFGACQNLISLDLSGNTLNGTIPKEVIGLSSLRYVLNLSNNALSGSVPSEVGNLSSLQALGIAGNRLSRRIPSTLGSCLTLEYLSIKDNFFEGYIPKSLIALEGIQYLDLSNNKLSGEIPEYLVNFTRLTYLNLSYNELKGPVPKDGVLKNISAISVVGNSKLCGGIVGLKLFPCNTRTLKKKGNPLFLKLGVPVIVVTFSLVLLLWFFLRLYRKKTSKKNSSSSLFGHQYPRISYAELLKATNGFSVDNLLGVGNYASVYKGILDQDNMIIAVKVLNLQQRGASKSFLSECNAFRNLRHRNLLKIITSCSSVDFQGNDFKELVFEFMPNGSIEEWLHQNRDGQEELRNLTFLQRLNIAVDVAFGLEYLHHHCQPTIVHCDIKPSNILLDDDMTAHVADFGLAKIFSIISYSQSRGSSLVIKGSIGSVAPEYGLSGEVSMEGDVYSFGIPLLEMLTGRRPTDEMFQDGQNLHSFAKMALPEQVINILDPRMRLEDNDETTNNVSQSDRQVRMHECLVSAIRLGVACSSESPTERMNMGDVLTELCHIRNYHQGVRTRLL